jgi:hypothetical protein
MGLFVSDDQLDDLISELKSIQNHTRKVTIEKEDSQVDLDQLMRQSRELISGTAAEKTSSPKADRSYNSYSSYNYYNKNKTGLQPEAEAILTEIKKRRATRAPKNANLAQPPKEELEEKEDLEEETINAITEVSLSTTTRVPLEIVLGILLRYCSRQRALAATISQQNLQYSLI